jgi:peptide/nickel transport system substrate-binding protein
MAIDSLFPRRAMRTERLAMRTEPVEVRSSSSPVCVFVLTALLLLTVTACRTPGERPAPTPTASSTPRPFTVMSTDQIRVTDPAAITDAASTVLALNAFQRLMTADPGGSVLKPDAARDCLFTAATVYTCTLNDDLAFHNGHPLTSSDVKFSIERAARLKIPGSSAAALSSYRRIQTPDTKTIRFVLSRPDTQFGWALASPAASIVDEEVYNADRVQDPNDPIVGSGPYQVTKYTGNQLQLSKYDAYVGRNSPRLPALVYRSVADSPTIEDAMSRGTVDVVWRGLDAAAVTRFSQQVRQNPDHQTLNGFTETVLGGARVLQLEWSPNSPMRSDKALRQAIAVALQGDRTSDSLVPTGVEGHTAAFPLGGKAKPKVTWKSRINLTLGYDATMPNGQDLAAQIRSRLENTGGLSVQLRPGDLNADLNLVDRKAWTATALAWLQPYLDAPLPAAESTVSTIETEFRATTDSAAADRLLAALQTQAAVDLIMLPISQSDEHLYLRQGVEMSGGSFGPGWQLGFFGISNA